MAKERRTEVRSSASAYALGRPAAMGVCVKAVWREEVWRPVPLVLAFFSVSPQPPGVRSDERECKNSKDLVCPQPDVLVASDFDLGLKARKFRTCPAIHSISHHDEIRVSDLVVSRHLSTKPDLYTELLCSMDEDFEQTLSVDGIAMATAETNSCALYIHDLAIPTSRPLVNISCGLGISTIELR
jgi:hypothetical protein